MLVMASERWATTARIYARGQKHGRPNGTMERGAIVARTLHDRGKSRRAADTVDNG